MYRPKIMQIIRRIVGSLITAVRNLSPTCRQASRLQSEQLDHPLPTSQRVGLRIHLLLCRWCRRYGRQLGFLRNAVRVQDENSHLPENATLSSDARERMKRAVREHVDRS